MLLAWDAVTFDHAEYDLKCEWGACGLAQLAKISDVLIVVDVLSFSTAVDIAVTNGATVFPYGDPDASLEDYARARSAHLAEKVRARTGFSLSPASLRQVPSGYRLVLPSRNGSSLVSSAGGVTTFTACLRNASAVAKAASRSGTKIAVIPAGERWPDNSLRPCFEDWIGAGAVLSALPGQPSPEAQAAIAAFESVRDRLLPALKGCSSGKELIERGFADDALLAAELDVSTAVPLLRDGAFY